jgi:3-hydroxyacyl-[acyl-carrier-protein] dehydratase
MRWYWVDRFLEFERGRHAVAVKNVSLVEEELDDYFPGFPVMPFSLMIEGMAQTAGLLIAEKGGFEHRVVLAKLNKAVAHFHAVAGDTLRYTATVLDIQKDGAIAKVTCHVGDKLQGEVEMMFAFLDDRFPAGPLFHPEDFIMLMRTFGIYDVGRDENGQPLEVPAFYREAEQAAQRSYETGAVPLGR